jgi:hypothetical protein
MKLEIFYTTTPKALVPIVLLVAVKYGPSEQIGSNRDANPTVCSMLFTYSMGQGKERRNKVAIRYEEGGRTKTRKEGKWAGTSAEDAVGKSSKAYFILSTDRKT